MGFPTTIPKYSEGELSVSYLNTPLYPIEDGLRYLKERVEELTIHHPSVYIDHTLDLGMESRIVHFDSSWKLLDDIYPLGEILNRFPMGIATHDRIYTHGAVPYLDSSIVDGTLEVGIPYYVSPTNPGKLTSSQPTAAIFMGVFLDTTTFYINCQYLTVSHIHRRQVLDPENWTTIDDIVSYPLDQVPVPPEGLVVILDNQYMPPYGKYTVDSDGYLQLTETAFFETLLDTEDLLGTVSGAEYIIEIFYSDPRTLTTPGVMKLESQTDNLILENNVPGQPTSVGSLKIKSIPVIAETGSGGCVTSLSVDQTTGVISVRKDGGIYALSPGEGVLIEDLPNGAGKKISLESSTILEEEFTDISLLGAASKLDLAKGYSYIEFGSTEVGLLAKKILPSTRDTSKSVVVSIVYSGSSTLRVKLCTPTYQDSWHSLHMDSGDFQKKVIFTKLTSENVLFLSLYGTDLIIYGITIQYYR